jgi:hypothetical protein
MKHPMRLRLASIAAAVLSGCATAPKWQTVSTPSYVNEKQGYAVTLPVSWIVITDKDASEMQVSHDGEGLNLIVILQADDDKAFPGLQGACSKADTLPSDLASNFIAQVKANQPAGINLEVLKNEPATLAGKDGFHLVMEFATPEGLRYRNEMYGVCGPQGAYAVGYRAPVLYYFEQGLPAFQAVVASFQFTGTSSGAGH